jgi:PleD family two-component response regulator
MPTPAKSPELNLAAPTKRGPNPAQILVADDQQHILDAIELLLKPQGYKVDAVRCGSPKFKTDPGRPCNEKTQP